MKTKLAMLCLLLCGLNLFASAPENGITGIIVNNKEISSYPPPKYIYFKDIQDEKNEWDALRSITYDDLKKHNKIVATGNGYVYKIIEFELVLNRQNEKIVIIHVSGDSIGPGTFAMLERKSKYTMYITNIKVIAPDSSQLIINKKFLGAVFPDSTELLAARYYPKEDAPRIAKYDIRITLEGNINQEDRNILKNIVDDYNSVLSTVKVKIVNQFPTIRIVLRKSNKNTPETECITSKDRNELFFPKLKIHKECELTSQDGLINKTNQSFLYKEIANTLNAFDKYENYQKSNIMSINKIFRFPDIMTNEAWERSKHSELSENSNSQNIPDIPGLTYEDKMALKIMFSPQYDKLINDNFYTEEKPLSTYFLIVVIFSIIVFIIGYELWAYYNIEQFIHNKIILNSIAILVFVQCIIGAMVLFLPFHPGFLDPLWKYDIYFSIYALLCVWLFMGSEIIQNKIKSKVLQLVANPVITLVVLYLAYQIIYLFVRGERLQFQTIDRNATIIGFTIMVVRFYLFYEQRKIVSLMQEKEFELTQQKELKNRAELNALQARINPHFLYNALNSIASLAHTSADRTEKMALTLSKLFRYNVNRESEYTTTLGEEIEMVQLYLEIEKQRFAERLNFSIDADKQLYNRQIPRFLIQPLVENAIKHGISKITGEGIIKLKVYQKDEGFCIEIHDNGPAFPIDSLVNGYGLQNTYDKLNMVYKRAYELKFINNDGKYLLINLQ
jgi:two-component sensor histidine kinase